MVTAQSRANNPIVSVQRRPPNRITRRGSSGGRPNEIVGVGKVLYRRAGALRCPRGLTRRPGSLVGSRLDERAVDLVLGVSELLNVALGRLLFKGRTAA